MWCVFRKGLVGCEGLKGANVRISRVTFKTRFLIRQPCRSARILVETYRRGKVGFMSY